MRSSLDLVCKICWTLAVIVATADGVRLPRYFLPRHYTLRLLPRILDVTENAAVDGFVQIDIHCLQNTREVVLHAVDIRVNLESIKLYDRASKERFFVQNITEDVERQFVTLHIRRKSMNKGANYVLSMNFISRLYSQDRPRGFYRLNYMEAGQPSMMALTQMEPIDARRVFPCFDEPNLKADFTITVGRPAHMISVSNMPKDRTTVVKELPGYEWDSYHRSYPMPTYLVSLAILESSSWLNSTDGNVALRLWARPSLLNDTKYSLKLASKMLEFYENYLEVAYPLPKQDMIAVPSIESAMENWGLIIYGEHILTHGNATTSAAKKELNTLVVAHETAHQWFGNLVTLNWWADVWLNEGLATYLSYVAVDHLYPEYKIFEQFVLDEMHTVMYDDAQITSHPVYQPADLPEEITSIFDNISYKKGASVLRMLAEFLGHKTFTQGLKRYLKNLEYGNAVQDDLWSSFTRQAQINKVKLPYDIKFIMETWTHHVGYPVVTIARNYSARTATAVQSRFLLHRKSYAEDDENLWVIPLSFTSAKSKETRLRWMPPLPRPENISDLNVNADRWVIFNVNRSGYYRVNYDERNWNLIWAQLLHELSQIPTISRAQIVDDAFNLARADLLPYRTAMNLANYLKKEDEYLPWKSAFDAFQYIDSMLASTPTYEAFKQFTIGILSPMYDRVTFFEKSGDDSLTVRLRSEAVKWACYWQHEDCVNNSLAVYRDWMSRPDNVGVVPADLKRTVTCTAVRHLGYPEWEFAWAKFQESNIHAEKSDLLSGMGCSTNVSLLSGMLNWTLEPAKLDDLFLQDIISSIAAGSEEGKYLVFDFVSKNWEALKTRYGLINGRLSLALVSVVKGFNTLSDLDKLELLNQEYGNEIDTINYLAYLYLITEANVLWMAKQFQPIDEWLHQVRL